MIVFGALRLLIEIASRIATYNPYNEGYETIARDEYLYKIQDFVLPYSSVHHICAMAMNNIIYHYDRSYLCSC